MIEGQRELPNPTFLLSWSYDASTEALVQMRENLLKCGDPAAINRYLRVLQQRALPEFDAGLLAFLETDDRWTRQLAYRAVSFYTDARIRRHALQRLDLKDAPPNVLALFEKNYAGGDDELLFDRVPVPTNPDDCHQYSLQVEQLMLENPEADCYGLAMRAYRINPCGHCRHTVVELIIDGGAPDWFLDECRADSEPDTRTYAGTTPFEPRLV
jgi:hypothetical protein